MVSGTEHRVLIWRVSTSTILLLLCSSWLGNSQGTSDHEKNCSVICPFGMCWGHEGYIYCSCQEPTGGKIQHPSGMKQSGMGNESLPNCMVPEGRSCGCYFQVACCVKIPQISVACPLQQTSMNLKKVCLFWKMYHQNLNTQILTKECLRQTCQLRKGSGGICPKGHFCPLGTTTPLPCSAGEYQDTPGQSSCRSCPSGYYCPGAVLNYLQYPCPKGYYCPPKTGQPTQFPCPSGTYNQLMGQKNDSACHHCPPGFYCQGTGLATPTGPCRAGYYCTKASSTPIPELSTTGGLCTIGHYCPEASAHPQPCDPGWYCPVQGLSTSYAQCSPGYYCSLRATVPNPEDGITGNTCPRGSYCPTGSATYVPCPAGYYLNVTGSSRESSCQLCPAGFYCHREGLALPQGRCHPGYYCPAGQISPKPINRTCPLGHYCQSGQALPQPCPSGYYQDEFGAVSCKVCPAGFYCDASSGPVVHYSRFRCPAGFYCPRGTVASRQFPCPPGTFSNHTGLWSSTRCLQCLAGFACDEPGLVHPKRACLTGYYCRSQASHVRSKLLITGSNADICPAGYYCPKGTVNPNPCPVGTFNPNPGQGSELTCWSCTPGKYCANTGLRNESGPCSAGYFCPGGSQKGEDQMCPAGHYCRLGSAAPTPCPMGTFSNLTGLTEVSECTPCPLGRYCSERGLMKPAGLCQAGYFCPRGSFMAAAQICQRGWVCPEGSGEPQSCPTGTHTDTDGASECSDCPEGYYCTPEQGSGSNKKLCPKGQFCPRGSGDGGRPCPVGTYGSAGGLCSASQCTLCPGARYCQDVGQTAPSGFCAPGYYCVSGASSPTPCADSICSSSETGGICPVGHFCPLGTARPLSCLPGTYNNQTSQSVCQTCPEGYYCPGNTTSFLEFPCPEGHFCPSGSRFARTSKTQCPPGTFNPHTVQPSRKSCLSCPPGFYCRGYGNTKPTGLCAGGWYCSGNADSSQTTLYGGRCLPGTFCPVGSPVPVNCTAGYYCPVAGLSQPQGACKAGWYCPTGSHSPTQVLCPVGHYCPSASDIPTPCRQGTFSSSLNNAQELACHPCTPGHYCSVSGLEAPSGLCLPGYYCPGGQAVPDPEKYLCPATHYCPEGSRSPTMCADGTYQLQTGSSGCDPCDAGYFCDNSVHPVSTLNGHSCPAGFYCPSETRYRHQFPCPIGSFNPLVGQGSQRSCIGCTPGYYCEKPGLSEPQGQCLAGHYCIGNSTRPDQHLCPWGSYCAVGSAKPTPCPVGFTSPGEGITNVSGCIPCYPGHYCPPGTNTHRHSLPCDPGHVCLGQASVPNPADGVTGFPCHAGHYCPRGAIREAPCERGSFQPLQGQVNCLQCPAGRTCPWRGMEDAILCPSGHYCPPGTLNDGQPCPVGTYSNASGKSNASDCIPCSSGQYCGSPGLSEPTGNCSAGYLCIVGATTAMPKEVLNHPCPKGHFCEEGTIRAIPCPRGTLNPDTHGASLAACRPCLPGYYCAGVGLSHPTGPCMERYFCPGNVPIDVPNPPEFVCLAGFFCPNSTASPLKCPPGTYQASIGSTGCHPCPEGSFCLGNTTVPVICPPHSYCPPSSVLPIPCPNGPSTNENTVRLTNASGCSDCLIGKYCPGDHITDRCAAGMLYNSGHSRIPLRVRDPATGKPCPEGSHCLAGYYSRVGSAVKKPCPVGTYSHTPGAGNPADCRPCEPGYWCQIEGLSDYTRYPCPVAHFCPKGTGTPGDEYLPKPCPPGTYRDVELGADILDCWPCRAGTYSPNKAAISCIQCDPGMFCPEGTPNQTLCPAGYYCSIPLPQLPCPAGYYCPEGSQAPVECPVGHYCPQGIISHEGSTWVTGAMKPVKCPLGHREYDGSSRNTFNSTCEPCLAGYYGNHSDRQICLECRAGVVCLQGSTTTDPPSNVTEYELTVVRSYICPKGHYCPNASAQPTACPVGTYNPGEGGGNVESCLRCPVNYFNHLTGQAACFTCGSQAVQPEEGRDRCICPQTGQMFQPSDSHCVCAVRHQMVSEGTRECVRKLYDICREGASRNQDGACLTVGEWEEYCSLKVCASPADYQGFDRDLGLCLCRVAALDSVCDQRCRRLQRNTLQIVCKGGDGLRITYRNGLKDEVPLNHIGRILNSRSALEQSQCQPHHNFIQPVYLVEMSEKGFLGVYDPHPRKLRSLLELNLAQHLSFGSNMSPKNATMHVTSPSHKDPEARGSGVHQSFVNGTLFSGIFNPTICIHTGSIILFTVSSEYYPVYDSVNLYNTDSDFDWGAFRDLQEELELTSSSSWLFTYRFHQPGVHVFQMSSNPSKKMYVRVMPVGGQCYEEGPFFPTTPRIFIRIGIRRTQDLPFKPDWLVISSLLAASTVTVGIWAGLMLLFRKISWPKKAIVPPRYQHLQKAYNFDDYSSKGAAIIAVKKIHRSLQLEKPSEENNEKGDRKEDSVSKHNEFGDYDQQIDLEYFNTNTFYQILLKQSLAVSVRLSQHKKEVKTLYQKITKVTESLSELWMERMNFAGRRVVNRTDMEMYEKMCCKVRLEIKRRKDIGLEFEVILDKQQQLLQADWSHREEHYTTFNVALREAVRLLEEPPDHEGKTTMENSLVNQRDSEQVEALLRQISDAITNECQRLSVWSMLGTGTGAQLVEKETLTVLSKEELIGADGANRDPRLLQVDQLTGLLTPSPDAVMLLANNYTMPVPGSFFLHPQTGRVLPMAGNVCYDSIGSRLLPATDSATGAVCQSEENLIPYVPYPLCPETSLPLKLQLGSLPHQSDVKLGGPMSDAETGIKVPILAVTIHLQTGLVYPLGGTYVSPITGMLAPIEIGAPMVCEKTGQLVPIIGVGLNTATGAVMPLGGVPKSSNMPMILGDSFTEPLSGRSARISGAYVQDSQVVPHAGGHQALLDGAMLASEVRVLEALKDYKDSVTAQGSEASPLHQKQRATLKEALDGLVRARGRSWRHIFHAMHNLERQRKEAKDLADRGGNVGMIPFAGTGLLIPAVVGMQVPDPGGSDLEVPILGVNRDPATGQLIPLAGTMEDPDGKGLIPIALGARSIDPITSEIGPVVGARIDPQTRIVVPVLQSSGGPMRRKLDGEMVTALDEELHCRREHWHHQRLKEEALFIALKGLLREVTDTRTNCRFTKVEDKVRALGEIIALLQDCAQSEAQRRHMEESTFSSLIPTDVIVLVSQVDKEEVEQQMLFLAAAQTILEKVMQFAEKTSQDEARQRGQLQQPQEAAFQLAEEASPLGYLQLKTLLTQEFQENIMNRWTGLDMVYVRLEHLRDLAELCALEAKGVLSGDVYRFGDYQLTRSQNASLFHASPDSTNRKMLPLIKQLINLLESDRNIILSPGTLNLDSNKEEKWDSLLLQSPVFKLLTEIHEHLKANPEAGETPQAKTDQQGTNQSKVKYQETGRPYIDVVDAAFTCEGNLAPLAPEKISVTELAVYHFGIFIVQLVKRVINAPEVNLLLASSLPMNNYTHNAFRNSFYYQHSRKTLFIRRQRLASVGDFSLLLVHCLAHLAAGELSDDSDARFLRFFHQALKSIFKEMFFSQLCAPPALHTPEPRASEWDNLFQKEDCPGIHLDVISDLLNVRLKDLETDFEEQDRETKRDDSASIQSKDQQSDKLNEHQSEIEKNNGVWPKSRSELDLQDVEEKIDDLTMELAALFDLEQKVQDRTMSLSKKRTLFKEIEELEAELDRRKK